MAEGTWHLVTRAGQGPRYAPSRERWKSLRYLTTPARWPRPQFSLRLFLLVCYLVVPLRYWQVHANRAAKARKGFAVVEQAYFEELVTADQFIEASIRLRDAELGLPFCSPISAQARHVQHVAYVKRETSNWHSGPDVDAFRRAVLESYHRAMLDLIRVAGLQYALRLDDTFQFPEALIWEQGRLMRVLDMKYKNYRPITHHEYIAEPIAEPFGMRIDDWPTIDSSRPRT